MHVSINDELLALALDIAAKAGRLLLDRPASWELTSKSTAIDIATQMDLASEKLIVTPFLRPGLMMESSVKRARIG